METDLTDFRIQGLAALAVAFTALFFLVRRDLRQPDRRTRLALTVALGIGVLAFSVKMAIVEVIARMPDSLLQSSLPPGAGEPGLVTAGHKAWQSRYDESRWDSLPAAVPVPPENPLTAEKIALGRKLFHEPLLSRDGSLSCASCHDVEQGAGADGRAVAAGIDGQQGMRNTPTVYNAAFQGRLFRDGRAGSLEEQAAGPILNPVEMGMPDLQTALDRLAGREDYRTDFARAFGPGAGITETGLLQALASYERTLVTRDSPWDRFVNGDETALGPAARRGMLLFQELGCRRCHAGPNFSGASLIGPRRPFMPLMADRSPLALSLGLAEDKGRAGPGAKRGIWAVPSLRNVSLTGPWLHNGAVKTLSEAVRIMAEAQLNARIVPEGAQGQGRWNPDEKRLEVDGRKTLTPRDISDIVAFLESLASAELSARLSAVRSDDTHLANVKGREQDHHGAIAD